MTDERDDRTRSDDPNLDPVDPMDPKDPDATIPATPATRTPPWSRGASRLYPATKNPAP
jgi:hypothetical protein